MSISIYDLNSNTEDKNKKVLGTDSLNSNNLETDSSKVSLYDIKPIINTSTPTYSDVENLGPNINLDEYTDYIPEGVFDIGEQNINYLRAERQPWSEDVAYGSTRLIGTTITKAGAGVGYLGGLTMEALKPSNWDEDYFSNVIDNASENAVSNTFNKFEESIKEAAPIYKTRQYDEGSILQKMATSEFWSDDLVDGAAFMASNFIPGIGLSKLGTGLKLAKYAKLANLTDDALGFAKNADKVTNFLTMSSMEAMVEAKSVKDQVYNSLIEQGVDPITAKQKAAEQAADAFALNMTLLAPSNWFETGLLFKGATKASVSGVEGIGRKLTKNSLSYFDEAADLKGFKAFANSTTGKALGGLTKSIAAEGLYEENLQLGIEHLTTGADGRGLNGYFESLSKLPLEGFKNLSTTEGQHAIVLGALLGGGMGLVTSVKESNEHKRLKAATIESLNTGATQVNTSSIYLREKPISSKVYTEAEKKEFETMSGKENVPYGQVITKDSTGKTVTTETKTKEEHDALMEGRLALDANNKPIIDEAQLLKVAQTRTKINELEDLLEVAYKNKNYTLVNLLKEEKFRLFSKNYFDAGMVDELFAVLDELSKFTPEDLVALGFEPYILDKDGNPISVEEQINEYKELAKVYQKDFDDIKSNVLAFSTNKADNVINGERQSKVFDTRARINLIDRELERVENRVKKLFDENEELRQVSSNVIEYQKNKHKQYLVDLEILDKEQELAEEENKLKTTNKKSKKDKKALERQLKNLKQERAELDKDVKATPEELDKFNKLKNVPEAFMMETVKAAELERMGYRFKNLNKELSDVNGLKYYKDNIQDVEGNLEFTPSTKITNKQLKLSTPELYANYEKVRLNILKLKDKITLNARNLFSQGVVDRINSGESIIPILKELVELNAPLTSEDSKEIIKYTEDILNRITKLLNKVSDLNQAAINAEMNGEIDEMFEFQEEIKSIQEDEFFIEYSSKVDIISDLLENFKNSVPVQNPFKLKNDSELLEDIAKEFYVTDFKLLEELLITDEEFSDVDSVEEILSVVTKLSELYSTKTGHEEFKQELADTIEKLKSIKVDVEGRKSKKELNQTAYKEFKVKALYRALGFDITNKSVDTTNKGIYDFIVNAIPSVKDILKEAEANNFKYIYAAIINQRIVDLASEDEGFRNGLLAEVQKVKQLKADSLNASEFLKSKDANITYISAGINKDGKFKEFTVEDYTDNAAIFADKLFFGLIDNQFSNNKHVEKFLKTKKINELISDLEKDQTGDNVEILNIARIHASLIELNSIERIASFDVDNAGRVLTENSELSLASKGLTPSIEQEIAIQEANVALSQPVKDELFSGFSKIWGFAGTGKSSVFAKWLLSILDFNPKEILAVGHTQLSTENINKSLGTSSSLELKELLLEETKIDESIKVIVIDEAGVLPDKDLMALANKIQTINKGRENKVRILLMGDPNQKTYLSEVSQYNVFSHISDAKHLKNIIELPNLTTLFRSNVGPLLVLQDSFRSTTEPIYDTKVFTLKSNTKDPVSVSRDAEILGAYGTNNFEEEVTALIKKRTGNGKTKAIITNNVQKYKDIVNKLGATDVIVTDAYGIQGSSIDEVYIDINKADYIGDNSSELGTNTMLNKDLYVATSRAINFIMISHIKFENNEDTTIGTTTSDRTEQIKALKTEFVTRKKEDLEVIKKLYGETSSSEVETETKTEEEKEEEKKVVVEEEEESEETNTENPISTQEEEEQEVEEEDYDPTENSSGINIDENINPRIKKTAIKVEGYELLHPTYDSIKNQVESELKADDILDVIIDRYEGFKRIRLVKVNSKGEYYEIGVITEDELSKLSPTTAAAIREALEDDSKLSNLNVKLEGGVLEFNEYLPITNVVLKSATPLTISYNGKIKTALNKKTFIGILNTVKRLFLNNENASTDVQIRIFKNGPELNALRSRTNYDIKPGIPYIYFPNPTKGGIGDRSNPIFIQLDPARLNSKNHSELVKPIQEFIELMDKFNKTFSEGNFEYGHPKFNEFVRALGEEKTDKALEILKEFTGKTSVTKKQTLLAKEIYNLVYTVDTRTEIKAGDKIQHTTEPFLNSEGKAVPRKVEEIKPDGKIKLYKDDTLYDAESLTRVISQKKPAGPAQRAFDLIAKTNLMSSSLILRAYSGGNQEISSGKGLLSSSDPIANVSYGIDVKKGWNYNKQKANNKTLKRIKSQLYKTGKYTVEELNALDYSEILSSKDPEVMKLAQPLHGIINIANLRETFNFGQDGNSLTKDGFGLRVPVQRKTDKFDLTAGGKLSLDEELFNEFAKYLESSFVGISPTVAIIDTNDSAKPSKPKGKKSKTKKVVEEPTDTESDTAAEDFMLLSEEVSAAELGLRSTEQEILAYVKKKLPNIEAEQVKFVSKSQIFLMAGQEAWGLYKDGIIYLQQDSDSKTTYEKIAKHEVFHKVVNEYLTKEEYDSLIEAAIDRYNLANKSPEAVEEFLAREYHRREELEDGILKTILRKITKIINTLFGNIDLVEDLFTKIDSGEFITPVRNFEGTRNLSIISAFGDSKNNIFEYDTCVNTILTLLNNSLNESIKNPVVEDNGKLKNIPRTIAEALENAYKHGIDQAIKSPHITEEQRTAIKKLKDAELFFQIATHIFPNVNIKLKKVDNTKSVEFSNGEKAADKKEIDSTTDEVVGTADKSAETIFDLHVRESDQFDHKNKITTAVKELIGFVTYKEAGRTKWVDPNTVYYALLNNIGDSVGVNKTLLENLNNRLKGKEGLSDVKYQERKAIVDKISSIYNQATKVMSDEYYFDDIFTLKNKENKTVLSRAEGESTEAFFKRIKNKTNLDYSFIRDRYLKDYYTNGLNELVSQMKSLTDTNPFIMLTTNSYGSNFYESRNITERGKKNTYLETFKIEFAENAADIFKGFDAIESKANKANDIKKLLSKLPMFTNINFTLSTKDANALYKALSFIYSNKSKSYLVVTKSKDYAELKTEQEKLDYLYNYLSKNLSGKLSEVVNMLFGYENNFNDKTNFTASDGTPRWRWMLNSYAKNTYKFLIGENNPNIKGIVNKFIKNSNTNLLKFNPLLKNIYDFADYYGNRINGEFENAIQYKDESQGDWLTRNIFLGMFSLRRNINDRECYLHNTWTNSNKPKTHGFYIPVLKDKDVEEYVESAIKQLAYKYNGKYSDYKNYEENKNNPFIIGLGVIPSIEDVKNPAKLKALKNKILTALDKKGAKFFQEYISNGGGVNTLIEYTFNDMANVSEMEDKIATFLSTRKDVPSYLGRLYEHYLKYGNIPYENKDGVKIENPLKELNSYFGSIFKDYYKMYYMNSYFLNQLSLGDRAFYNPGSKNSYDIIKRISIAYGQGRVGSIGEGGMRETFKLMVLKDDKLKDMSGLASLFGGKDTEQYKRFVSIFGDTFLDAKYTDGQGFITPKRYKEIQKGFGKTEYIGYALKPVIWDMDENGKPTAVKYSSIVLSDALVAEFPMLKDLRDKMEEKDVDEAVFASGVKVGAPKNLSEFKNGAHSIDDKSILTLSNGNYRLQENPYHDVDSLTAQASQINYYLNSNGLNDAEAFKVYNYLSKLVDIGVKDFKNRLSLKEDEDTGTMKESSFKPLLREILKNIKNVPGNERIVEFLAATRVESLDDAVKKQNLSATMNIPFIANKIVSQVNSLVTKAGISVKFPGSKLVLQSAYGVGKLLKDNNLAEPKWRDKDGYAECYLPETYKEFVQEGDTILFDKVFGFRIPSTELHSALPIKIIGFYPVDKNQKDQNIIIAPKEIVFFHGSDYDIDSLYIIRKNKLSNNISLGGISVKAKSIPNSRISDELITLLEKEIFSLIKKKSLLGKEIKTSSSEDILKKKKEINQINTELDKLKVSLRELIQNQITDTMLNVIVKESSLDIMSTPISQVRFNTNNVGAKDESALALLARLKGHKSVEDLDVARDLNDPIDQSLMHKDNFSGALLTGIFANAAKAVNYLITSNTEDVVVKDELSVTFNGTRYNKLSRHELTTDKDGNIVQVLDEFGKPLRTSDTVDSLINAAIDNVKEQILPKMNITNNTSKIVIGLVNLGVPLNTITRLLQQPVALELSNLKYINSKQIKSLRAKLVVLAKLQSGEELNLENVNITDSVLDGYIIKNTALSSLTKQQIEEQIVILDELGKLFTIGNDISKTSKFLSILRQLPSTYNELQDIQDIAEEIYEDVDNRVISSNFSFPNSDILNPKRLPHIAKVFKAMKTSMWIISASIYKHSRVLRDLSSQISMPSTPEEDVDSSELLEGKNIISLNKNVNLSRSLIRDEFMKFILTSLKFEYNGVTYDANTINEELYNVLNSKGEVVIELSGKDAFNRRLFDKLKALKKKDRIAWLQNPFLSNLIFNNNEISFTRLKSLSDSDLVFIEKGFDQIGDEEIKAELLKYAIVNQGLAFGNNNYSMVLPPRMFFSLLNNFETRLKEVFKNYYAENDARKTITSLRDIFITQLLASKQEFISNNFNKLYEPVIKKQLADTSNSFTIVKDDSELYNHIKFTKIAKVYDSVYMLVSNPNDKKNPQATYILLGKFKSKESKYSLDYNKALAINYNIDKAFNHGYPTMTIRKANFDSNGVFEHTIEEKYKPKDKRIVEGNSIVLKKASDISNVDGIIAQVQSVVYNKTDKTYTYKLKFIENLFEIEKEFLPLQDFTVEDINNLPDCI